MTFDIYNLIFVLIELAVCGAFALGMFLLIQLERKHPRIEKFLYPLFFLLMLSMCSEPGAQLLRHHYHQESPK